MKFYLYAAFSIFLPGLPALIRFKKIEPVFYPFIFCLWLGCINEILSFTLTLHKHPTLVNGNIYVLAEAMLLTVYFRKMGLFKRRLTYQLLLLSYLLVWIGENLVFRSITVNSTYFRIFYSFVVVFMSINHLNERIFSTRRHLLKDASFLLSLGFVVYFTYKALIQAFAIYGFNRHSGFLLEIYILMVYINLATNLLYAVAVLWMPRKARFIQPSSLPSLSSAL